MNSELCALFLLIVMLQWSHVVSFTYCMSGLHALQPRYKITSATIMCPSRLAFRARRIHALNPGVLEKIDHMRIQSKALEKDIADEASDSNVGREMLVEKLKELRTIIEAADSLAAIIENNINVIEEDTRSGKNKEIQASARKVYREFIECKELIEQQLNQIVVDGSDVINE